MTRRTAALTAAAVSLLPLGQPLILGTLGITTATTAVVLDQGAALAKDASVVARVAKQVTVVVAGAGSPGSGVLIKKVGNRYTVLTAWHVIKDTSASEVIEINTSDGEWHESVRGSVKRLGKIDMAVLTFESSASYEVASIGNIEGVNSGNQIFVSGFPLPSSSVPVSLFRFLKGDVIANATVAIPDGYQLLYSNPTLPGMSGGSVLNLQGQLVGIHGRSERDDQVSMKTGKAVSTGTNQAVPISYFQQFDTGQAVVAATTKATTADDYLAQTKLLLLQSGKEIEIIRLANRALSMQPSTLGYSYRGIGKSGLKDYQGALSDFRQAVAINPQNNVAYYNIGVMKSILGDKNGAMLAYSKAIGINPQYARAYYNRGVIKQGFSDNQGAIADYSKSINHNPRFADAYFNRGFVKGLEKDFSGAINDYNQSIKIKPVDPFAFRNRGLAKEFSGDLKGACADWRKASSLGDKGSAIWVSRQCQ